MVDDTRLNSFYLDLAEQEGTVDASLRLYRTHEPPDWVAVREGVTLEADRRYHGAELHLTWDQARQIRDELTRLLKEAGQE
jgi:hypothetical protein